ncbi:hypothetical protein [Brevibacillus formosus]|uniref:hypothetical protein n=1 Tax=Brevibacillus formosus TaxID=54913 RepID=UPI001F37093F|nr:hypothetical protein [Brevibacillus formosus]
MKNVQAVRKKISLTGQFAALNEGLSGLQNLILIGRPDQYSRRYGSRIDARNSKSV